MITTEEYRLLWNAITDTIRQIDDVKERLVSAQQRAEEMIIEKEDCGIIVLPKSDEAPL